MPELVTSSTKETFILFQDEVLNTIEKHRQLTSDSSESGGILIGEYRGDHINIVKATEPSRGDMRSRYRFFRRSVSHQKIALQRWRKSNTTQTFIGDWHTHAEDHPTPSNIDITDWSLKLPKRKMVLVIQGRCSRWYGFWDGKTLTQAKDIKIAST